MGQGVHLDSLLFQNISEYAKSGVSSDCKVADVVSVYSCGPSVMMEGLLPSLCRLVFQSVTLFLHLAKSNTVRWVVVFPVQ